MDWRKIEQTIADSVQRQGFCVSKDSSGRLVISVRFGETLEFESIARDLADRIENERKT